MLSSRFEGLPLAALEAMASGYLCILPNVEGIPEMVKAGAEAIFYDVETDNGLIETLRSAPHMTKSDRLKMIKAARLRVEKDFDAYDMADNYLRLYQQLYTTKMRKARE